MAVLREDIGAHGLRTPLRMLKNGWVIDGIHRYLIAKELGLEAVPVQLVPIVLSHRDGDPLTPVDRLRIERAAVLEALSRRHLAPHQRDVMFLQLEEAEESLSGSAAIRADRRLANLLWRRSPDDEPPACPTMDEFARTYQIPVRQLKRLLVLARHAWGTATPVGRPDDHRPHAGWRIGGLWHSMSDLATRRSCRTLEPTCFPPSSASGRRASFAWMAP